MASGRQRLLERAFSAFVGVLLIVAAAQKAWRIQGFIKVLAWLAPGDLGGTALPFAVALFVVVWEAWAGTMLLTGAAGKRTRAALLVTMVAFCGVLIRLAVSEGAPRCGCIGIGHGSPQWDATVGLVRNVALVVILLSLGRGEADERESRRSVPDGARAGFTLVELLFGILVIATLLALALPALARSRDSARRVRDLSNLSQAGHAVASYSVEYRDTFPYFHSPGSPTTPAIVEGVTLTSVSYFLAGAAFWPNLVIPSYAPGLESYVQPNAELAAAANKADGFPPSLLRSSVRLTFTAFAKASLWDPAADPFQHPLYAATKTGDVTFPSSKGLLVSVAGLAGVAAPDGPAVAFGDGSARFVAWGWNGDQVVDRPYGVGISPWIVMATRGGLGGRDF